MNTIQFKQVLTYLGFSEHGGVFTKHFSGELGIYLKADFTAQELIYPEDTGFKVNEKQTCNFSAPENFVVFECVHRLFEKGYHPKHIELEPRWKLGHTGKGGRADIWVKDNAEKSLLIIECKTPGKEFDDAWRDMQKDGAQLFSYFQQQKDTEFLALYTSKFENEIIVPEYKLVSVVDNIEYLKMLENPLSYRDAVSTKELYTVWSATYQKYAAEKGLFEKGIAPYRIGKNKYNADDDLTEISETEIQKKYHTFATILRQYNVSGHENAFDKLVNLFLAKIVDEKENKDELKFYWKGVAYDDTKSLIDRLQKLYQRGMKEFLGEEVTYIEKAQIKDAFKLFKNDPDATQETILKYFDELKYYTNNDFAFIDVHNKRLFEQNAVVLLEIVQMLQSIKLKTETQNQFLGDLFEGFLDRGVKQSEGQFFTPTPIVKFIISSLPLQKIIRENAGIPLMIDYACGAGHFLNEYARAIEPFVKEKYGALNRDYYKAITGIEKEYRLSKVAKVSAFMYGQDEINIMYADALAQTAELKDGSFSILAANPPYSVKGFLDTLSEEARKQFELTNSVSDILKNNAIETFFVERAKQLLQSGGVAGIILPSSILSNGGIYEKMREILLKYFDLIAVAEFGSGTFGKTGTNTATLFLRRKDDNPPVSDHYKYRVESWFSGDLSEDAFSKGGRYSDTHLFCEYCDHIGIPFDEYKTIFSKSFPLNVSARIFQTELFKEYRAAFEKNQDAKKIQDKKTNEKYTEKDKQDEYEKLWFEYLQKREKEKLYYYCLARSAEQPVVIVKSPTDSKAAKNFLGYEWSAAKGNEGIKYLGAAASNDDDADIARNKGINHIKTPLFNPNDSADETKINTLIRTAFEGKPPEIPEALNEFVSIVRLEFMLDFSRATFDKAFKTTPENKVEIKSKYPLVNLGGDDGICDILIGGTPSRRITEYFTGNNLWVSIAEMNGNIIIDTKEKITDIAIEKSNVKLIPQGTTLLSFKLSIGKTAIAGKDLYTNEAIAGLIPKSKEIILDKYLFCLFHAKMIDLENVGNKVFGKSLNSQYLKEEVQIPLPPLHIQQQIVAECEAVDEEYNASRMSIEQYRQKIAQVFENLEIITRGGGGSYLKIGELADISRGASPRPIQSYLTDDENGVNWIKIGDVGVGEKYITKTQEKITLEGAKKSKLVKEGDFIISNSMSVGRPYILKTSGCIHDGWLLLSNISKEIDKDYFYYILTAPIIQKQFNDIALGGVVHNLNTTRVAGVKIPVPSLDEQRRIVREVEGYEAEIAKLQAVMDGAGERKKRILEKRLKR